MDKRAQLKIDKSINLNTDFIRLILHNVTAFRLYVWAEEPAALKA